MDASICWVAAQIDTQSTIFDLSALKKQLLFCFKTRVFGAECFY
jgi:hypothetical protein